MGHKIGWRHESFRHALAARGVVTKRQKTLKGTVKRKIKTTARNTHDFLPQMMKNDLYGSAPIDAGRAGVNTPEKTWMVGEKTADKFFAEKERESPFALTAFLEEAEEGRIGPKPKKGCSVCGGPVGDMRDAQSTAEASKSGMCQKCQDGVFMAEKRTYSALKDMLTNPHEDAIAAQIRQQDVDVLQNDVIGQLTTAVDEQKLTGQNRERFMREIFANEAKMYTDGFIDKEEFEMTVKRKLGNFVRIEARPHAGQFSFDSGLNNNNIGGMK